jgi:chorismate dehydratase
MLETPANVGTIAFLNCHPIRWGLARHALPLAVHTDTPRQLARELLAGRLDVSALSLLDYLEHAGELTLLPGLAIGSDGPVQSCILASRVPLTELDSAPVRLSEQSRTTTLLARHYLRDVIGVRPRYVAQERCAARVDIGDVALHTTVHPPAGWTVHDMGALWRDWTGLPMVFAVWAARRDYASRAPGGLRAIQAALSAAIADASRHPDTVAAAAGPLAGGLDRGTLLDYFGTLDYSLGERQLAGMRAFARLASSHAISPMHR